MSGVMPWIARSVGLVALVGCFGCTGSEDSNPFMTSTSLTGGSTGVDSGGQRFDIGGGDLGDNPGAEGYDCDCAPKSDLVYLLSDQAELWLYNPYTHEFTQLGTFDCGGLTSTFSMGVSRDASAWIMLRPDGRIFKVDVNNANACTATSYDPNQFAFHLYGMAFASVNGANTCDRLFLHSFDDTEWTEGPGVGMLARVDPAALTVAPVSPIDYNGGELTGNRDGRLFAFAGIPDAEVIEYDPGSGDVIEITPLPGLQLTYAFAFAFWGGDFFFFTESGAIGSASKVTRLDFDNSEDGALTTVVPTAPMRVVGAGVSTCAPLVPPG